VDVPAVANRVELATHRPAGTSSLEFRAWMSHLDAHERDLLFASNRSITRLLRLAQRRLSAVEP
jgi:hypothetical protein